MSRFGKDSETESKVAHNERLEFLGDAVVEFVSSVHLYHMFPDLEEGGLATYRAALVQNQHLVYWNLQRYQIWWSVTKFGYFKGFFNVIASGGLYFYLHHSFTILINYLRKLDTALSKTGHTMELHVMG